MPLERWRSCARSIGFHCMPLRGGGDTVSADAEDLTQSFFARLLEHNFVARADPAKGRFRTFLLTLFKRFLANEWNREHAQKRGGLQPVVSINSHLAESRFGGEVAHAEQPDILFERHWAMTLLDEVMKRLEDEYSRSGRGRLFEHLEGCLMRDPGALPYAEIAARLDLTEAAVKNGDAAAAREIPGRLAGGNREDCRFPRRS